MTRSKVGKEIIDSLPYCKPFLFVDTIDHVSKDKISGSYRFLPTEAFYSGHFKHIPVTPGVLLLETMGQIGLVCFGIYLLNIHRTGVSFTPALSYLESDFRSMVSPGENVTVLSEKIYFRHSLLKCSIKLFNSKNEIVVTTTAICSFIIDSK